MNLFFAPHKGIYLPAWRRDACPLICFRNRLCGEAVVRFLDIFWFRSKNKLYGKMPTRHRNSKHSLYRWWMLWSIPRLIIFGVCVIFAIDKYILHAPQSQITLEVKKVRPLSSLLMEIFSTHDGGIHQPLTKGFVASIFVNDGCILHTSRRRIRPRI